MAYRDYTGEYIGTEDLGNGAKIIHCKHRKIWYLDDKIHRVGAPAIEEKNGDFGWYLNGQLHRIDAPAEQATYHFIDGIFILEYWFQNDLLHRENGPAILEFRQNEPYDINNINHKQEWYYQNKLHRIDGPAVIKGKCEEWYLHGKRHRLDGPAKSTGIWYKNGKHWPAGEPLMICIALVSLQLPAYVMLWIIEWVSYHSNTLNKAKLVQMIQNIRIFYQERKLIKQDNS